MIYELFRSQQQLCCSSANGMDVEVYHARRTLHVSILDWFANAYRAEPGM
jgi:hypothetical protein